MFSSRREDYFCDIIQHCHERHLDHVLERIFLSLDFQTFAGVQQVSRSWRSAINDNNQWSKYLEHQLLINHEWRSAFNIMGLSSADPEPLNDDSYCKKICLKLNSSITNLDTNLKTGHYVQRKVISSTDSQNSIVGLTMNDQYLVTVYWDWKVVVRNRPTLTTFKVLQIMRNRNRCFTDVRMAEDNRVVFASSNSIHIWDIESGTLMTKLRIHEGNIFGMEFKNNLLLTRVHTGQYNCMNVYRIKNHSDAVLASHSCFSYPYLLQQFVIDETYVIMLIGNSNVTWDDPHKFRIVLLSSQSLRLVRYSHKVKDRTINDTLSCANGWVVVGSHWEKMRLFDVETLTCKFVFKESFMIEHLRISGNFLITRNRNHGFKVWDFQAMCSGVKSRSQITNFIPDVGPNYYAHFLFDGKQIITFNSEMIWGSVRLDVFDFLNCTPPVTNCETSSGMLKRKRSILSRLCKCLAT